MSATTETDAYIRLFSRYLREQGLPVTHQREVVADVVFSSVEHLSVDDIEREMRAVGERIGKATIYRTLDLLVKSNLVAENDFGEGFKRYEHRLSREPLHEHLICLHCGTVAEFHDSAVHQIEALVTAQHGFRPIRHKLEIYGLCRECQSAGVSLPREGLICPIDSV
ncbi:MAG: transcriptional repressor [Gemmatimonadetes bacterium]|nr:transcriptional repressor [Gemmatimonadota bacterium]